MVFGAGILNRKRVFPETIESNGIVFRFSQERTTKDQARLEAIYTKREGYYVRVIKRGNKYGVYTAEKR